MSSTIKNKHEKKSNVINRTTSETLRLGDTDVSINHRVIPPTNSHSHSIQVLPSSVSRKKIQTSSSSFQITGVSVTRTDFGDDSADDLDESHTDDISRVTDNETPSFSEDSRDIEDHQIYETANAQIVVPQVTQILNVQEVIPSTNMMQVQEAVQKTLSDRFTVVKMPHQEPFSKGRWTCFDYADCQQNINITYIFADGKYVKKINELVESHKAPYNQDPPKSEFSNSNRVPSKLTEDYLPTQSLRLVNDNQDATGSQVQEMQSFKNLASFKDRDNTHDILSDIKVALKSTCVATNNECSPSNNNIDKKIEEALDAVKTHLMVAVHKEVDFLKTRVSTLEGRVNELEIENSILRGTLRAKSEDGLTGEQLDHYLYQLSFSIRYNHIAKMSQLHDTDYISSGVYLGDGFTAKDRKYLVEHGFTHVLNAAEGSDKYQVNTSQQYYQNSNIKYFGVPGHDRPSWNISIYFESASQFIDEAVKSGGKVLVHCVVGISRSATLVVAYLMMCKGMDVKEALAFTLRQRNINPNIGFLRHLADLNQKLKSRKKNSLTGVSKE